MEKIVTLQNLMDGVREMEVEIIKEDGKKSTEAKKSNDFNGYFQQAVNQDKLTVANLPNQILAFQVFDKYKSAKVDHINTKKLYNDIMTIGKTPIDRTDLDTRVSVVANNAQVIACAMDLYNPDIIDSMIRMEAIEEALNKNTEEEVVENNGQVDVIFSALFEASLSAQYGHKQLEMGDDEDEEK